MDIIKIFLGTSFLLLMSAQVHAVIIGDKDWRQLANDPQGQDGIGYSWNDFDAIFDTTTGECDVAGCLLERPLLGSVDLTGYTWASNSEVNELFKYYAGGSGLTSLNSNNTVQLENEALFSFFNDFNYTYSDSLGGQSMAWANGWTRNYSAGQQGIVGDMMWASQFYPNGLFRSQAEAELGLDIHRDTVCMTDDCRIGWPGGWVYRKISSSVPEPSILALMLTGLIGLSLARRKIRPYITDIF